MNKVNKLLIFLLLLIIIFASCSSKEAVRIEEYGGDIDKLRAYIDKARMEEEELRAVNREKKEQEALLAKEETLLANKGDKTKEDKKGEEKEEEKGEEKRDKTKEDKKGEEKEEEKGEEKRDKTKEDKKEEAKEEAKEEDVLFLYKLKDKDDDITNIYDLPKYKDKVSSLKKGLSNNNGEKLSNDIYYNPNGYFIKVPSYFDVNKKDSNLITAFYEKKSSHSIQFLIGIAKGQEALDSSLEKIKKQYKALYSVKWADVTVFSKEDLLSKRAKEGISVDGISRTGTYHNIYYIYLLKDARDYLCFFIAILSLKNSVKDIILDEQKKKVLELYSSFHFF